MDTRFIHVNGVQLYVVQAGEAPARPVLLLHGFPEFWYSWHSLIDPLTKAGYRLWMPDQRGYHLSDKPASLAAYSLDEIAKDILGLADAMGQEKILLVGHDWGGAAAWWFANKHPERVEKLVIFNAPHHAAFGKALKTGWEQRLRSGYMLFFQLPYLPEFCLKLLNWQVTVSLLRLTSRPNTFTYEDIENYRAAWRQKGAITTMLNWYRAAARVPRERPASTRITVPTLILWGGRDVAFQKNLAQMSLEKCDEGRLVMIDEGTHWVHHEFPEKVAQWMLEFWKSPSL